MEAFKRRGGGEALDPGAPDQADPALTVAGRYALGEELGSGGFSMTYLAHDTVLDRPVAVKLLRQQYASDQTFVARFAREARLAASVSHPNIVDVYDYGPHGDTYFIAMQYVKGKDLKRLLGQQGSFAPEKAVALIQQILGGLSTIHKAGIIHRDIKPQNILIGNDGVARLTDFGIAHVAVDSGLTSHGTTIGSASYMAPEQARGGVLTEATDLYAVGVVLFELLTNRLPFEAPNPMAVMLAHIQRQPPRPSDLPLAGMVSPELDEVVLRALAKERSARFTSTTEMADALRKAVPEGGDIVPSRDVGDTTTLAGATTAPLAAIARATAAQASSSNSPQGGAIRPVPLAPPLPSQRPARGWLIPLLVAILALAGVAAAVSYFGLDVGTGDPPGGGGATDGRGAGTVATPQLITGIISLSTREPTVTPADTTTPDPSPTETPSSTATSITVSTNTPTPFPTQTSEPEPTATVAPIETAPPAPIQDRGPPTIAPSGVSQGGASGGPEASSSSGSVGGGSLAFTAADWSGGHYQSSGYGRPWTAIYGQGSGMSTATISFSLEGVPRQDVKLVLTGLDDEAGGSVPIRIDINGTVIYSEASPFQSWSGVEGSYPWEQATSNIPARLFQSGSNTMSVTNLAPSGQFGFPPYLLLSEISIDLND
ncbi:MAG: protein kinase [Chloroflexota bacterium]|nr:protein kinase [Chloroflexota bacterium]